MAAVQQPFLSDFKTLRERARKHIEEGAVTSELRSMLQDVHAHYSTRGAPTSRGVADR